MWLMVALCALGCGDDDNVLPMSPSASDYFPLSVGQTSVYSVEEVLYNLRDGADTSRYQLREVVAEAYEGAGGEIIHTLERYTRASSQDAWVLDSLWTARKNEQEAIVVESNVPYVKLTFPFEDDLQWNGNALNNQPALTYTLSETDSTLRKEMGTALDSLLINSRTVVQRQLETLVNDSILTETYAPGVGLIHKKSRILQYCADEECIGQKVIEAGRSYRQTLIAYE